MGECRVIACPHCITKTHANHGACARLCSMHPPGCCRSGRVATGRAASGLSMIDKETPYCCYGVTCQRGTSITFDEFLFKLPRDREACAYFASAWAMLWRVTWAIAR